MPNKLFLTVSDQLVAKYGSKGAADIRAKLVDYVTADAGRGLTSRVLYADVPSRTGFSAAGSTAVFPPHVGFRPDEEDDDLDTWIQDVNDYCRAVKKVVDAVWDEFKFDYLMIIGANDVVPFFRAPNPMAPLGPADVDTTVPTDNPYGAPSLDAGLDMNSYRLPEIPVGRLPDEEGSKDESFLLRLLDHGISEAGREQAGKVLQPAGWALTAASWLALSTDVAMQNQIPASRVEESPPVDPSSFPLRASLRRSLHYFNLHGGLGTGVWNGDNGAAFGPAQIPGLQLPDGAGAVTEACYGADLIQRTAPLCCGLTYLNSACSAFVGSSTMSYGRAGPPGDSADVIASKFLEGLRGGSSCGASLLRAKQLLARATTPFGGLSPTQIKTLFQFYLLGDPSHHPMQAQVVSYLRNVEERRESLRDESTKLRGDLFLQMQAKTAGTTIELQQLPEAGQSWLAEINERLPGLEPAGEMVEAFEMPAKSLADLPSFGPEAQNVSAVHRAFTGTIRFQVTDDEARYPKPVYLASAFFAGGRLLRESLVGSR